MAYNSIVVSSGHGLYVSGACGIVDEVPEARAFTESLAEALRYRGIDVVTYHDDVSTSQSENLNRITDFHNSTTRDLDISVHLNCYEQTSQPRGVEVLYTTQGSLAGQLSLAISEAGNLVNRGAKYRGDLHFLNCTSAPAVLLELHFVDSEADCISYRENYDAIVEAVADVLCGLSGEIEPPPPQRETCVTGKASWFGGPDDDGVSESEGLAFIYDVMDAPHLFLPEGTPGTEGLGLARRLNPFVHFFAMRFDYSLHPKETLLEKRALIRNVKTGMALQAIPADWGPHESTGRVVDLSQSLMEDLGLETDDVVEVIFTYEE